MGCIHSTTHYTPIPYHDDVKYDKMDANLFIKNAMQCNRIDNNNIIDNCQCLQRLSYTLKYYSNKENAEKDWIDLCVNTYAHQMLDDYSHLLSTHYQQVEQIKQELITNYGFDKCSIKNCKFSDRHFNRDREEKQKLREQKQEDNAVHKMVIYQQEYDSLHFNLFHLFDVGYRFKIQKSQTNNQSGIASGDGNNTHLTCIDYEFTEMIKKISNDRGKYKNIFGRFKTEKNNNKFNINIQYNDDESDDKTFMD
eukprot:541250_1